jgi:hypothetical protein
MRGRPQRPFGPSAEAFAPGPTLSSVTHRNDPGCQAEGARKRVSPWFPRGSNPSGGRWLACGGTIQFCWWLLVALEWQQIVVLPSGRWLTNRRTPVVAAAQELDGAGRDPLRELARSSPPFPCQTRGFWLPSTRRRQLRKARRYAILTVQSRHQPGSGGRTQP